MLGVLILLRPPTPIAYSFNLQHHRCNGITAYFCSLCFRFKTLSVLYTQTPLPTTRILSTTTTTTTLEPDPASSFTLPRVSFLMLACSQSRCLLQDLRMKNWKLVEALQVAQNNTIKPSTTTNTNQSSKVVSFKQSFEEPRRNQSYIYTLSLNLYFKIIFFIRRKMLNTCMKYEYVIVELYKQL